MTRPINTRVPEIGDFPSIGDEVASSIEPSVRWARIVGFLKSKPDPQFWGCPEFGGAVIVRVFQKDDTDFPTGEYRRASAGIGICPITP
jgi:hypothetical protein